jgi:hypothetical protein
MTPSLFRLRRNDRIFLQQNQIFINYRNRLHVKRLQNVSRSVFYRSHLNGDSTMPVTAAKPAPYAPPTAILDIVGRYRSRGLPTPVNADVLARAGISESLIPRTLQALQALDLIDKDGTPTQTFEGLRLAPEAEYKERKAAWLRSSYADIFAFVDPGKDGTERIRDAFRSYQPIGQQDRMVTLFTGLCIAAGLITENPTRTAAKSPGATPGARATVRRVLNTQIRSKAGQAAQRSAAHAVAPDLGLPPALAGLLASLPPPDEGWVRAKRDKFVETFESVLDFCIPIVAHEPDEDEEPGEADAA